MSLKHSVNIKYYHEALTSLRYPRCSVADCSIDLSCDKLNTVHIKAVPYKMLKKQSFYFIRGAQYIQVPLKFFFSAQGYAQLPSSAQLGALFLLYPSQKGTI